MQIKRHTNDNKTDFYYSFYQLAKSGQKLEAEKIHRLNSLQSDQIDRQVIMTF